MGKVMLEILQKAGLYTLFHFNIVLTWGAETRLYYKKKLVNTPRGMCVYRLLDIRSPLIIIAALIVPLHYLQTFRQRSRKKSEVEGVSHLHAIESKMQRCSKSRLEHDGMYGMSSTEYFK